MAIGRRKCILLTNIVVVVGSVLCLLKSYPLFVIGRFLFGASAGAFSLFCPKFLAEVAPTEYKAPIGALSQLLLTFGILIPFAIGLAFPDPPSYSSSQNRFIVILLVSVNRKSILVGPEVNLGK